MLKLSNLSRDLRFGGRALLRAPGFTTLAVLALGLGIGANSAIFSVVDAVLLRPLPYPDANRLVMVWEDATHAGFPRNTPAPANWVDWRKQNEVFTDIAATRGGLFALTGDGPGEMVRGRRVTASFWTVLGVAPTYGRVFTDAEDAAGARVAVLGHGLWRRRFGGDPRVIGREFLINDQKYVLAGVMPPGFAFPGRDFEIWTPAAFTPQELARRGSHFLQCIARLRPGISVEQAQAAMSTLAKQLEQKYPDTNTRVGAVVVPMREQIAGQVRTGLIVLLSAAGCVLLIACANVANLLQVRAAGRRRELAVRAALGAGRGRLLAQMMSESLLLAGLGAAAGLLLARTGMIALERLIPLGIPTERLVMDTRVLAFSAAAALAAGLLSGLWPAWAVSRVDLHDALREGGRGIAGGGKRGRQALVIAELALAQVLLAGAGLMIQTLARLHAVDPGFRTENLLTLSTPLPTPRYAEFSKRDLFFNSVLEKVKALPGVVSAGYTSALPLTAIGNTNGYMIEGQPPPRPDQIQDALFRVVTPEFLPTIGARMREGRFFGREDRADSLPVVIINETFANAHFPGVSPLGRRIQMGATGPNRPWQTIVGVVKEVRERGIDIGTKPAVYWPQAQGANAWPVPQDLAVRTSVPPLSVVNEVRAAIVAVDKDQPVQRVRTMEEVHAEGFAVRRQSMNLLAVFAGLALALAALGVYGVLSFAVTQRTREIGVRLALGAQPSGIVGIVVGQGLALAGAGLAIGIAASLAATRMLGSLLYGVPARDPATLIAVAAVLALVALLACYFPARRASRVDPCVALREE